MIKATGTADDGSDVVMLGVSEENVKRLVAGDPIIVRMEELGMVGNLVIFYGKTEEEMATMFKKKFDIGEVVDHREEH